MRYVEYVRAYWVSVLFTIFQGKETQLRQTTYPEQRHRLPSRNSWEGRISPGSSGTCTTIPAICHVNSECLMKLW